MNEKHNAKLLLQIEVPDVIFSDSLESIGESQSLVTADTYTGVGVFRWCSKGAGTCVIDTYRHSTLRTGLHSCVSLN